MIFVLNEGKGIRVTIQRNDEILEDIAELSAVIESYKNAFYNEVPQELADTLITAAGKLAYSNGAKEIHAVMDELNDYLEDFTRKKFGDAADEIIEAVKNTTENE